MAATGMELKVNPPRQVARRWATLLSSADQLDTGDDPGREANSPQPQQAAGARWAGGVTFVPPDCDQSLANLAMDWCPDDDVDDLTDGSDFGLDAVVFQAFQIWGTDSCSAMAVDDDFLSARNGQRFTIGESKQVARELMTGEITGNPALVLNPTIVAGSDTTALSSSLGLAALEDAVADQSGAEFTFHMSPGAFSHLQLDGGFEQERAGSVWRTPTGHLLIADAGYGNFAPMPLPEDEDDLPEPEVESDGSWWIYASGPVQWKLSAARELGPGDMGFDRSRNLRTNRMVKDALVVHVPCTVFAVHIDPDAD